MIPKSSDESCASYATVERGLKTFFEDKRLKRKNSAVFINRNGKIYWSTICKKKQQHRTLSGFCQMTKIRFYSR